MNQTPCVLGWYHDKFVQGSHNMRPVFCQQIGDITMPPLPGWAEDKSQPVQHIAQWFNSDHLADPLKLVVGQCEKLAENMCDLLGDGPELAVALRKLLEAKDAFVRQAVVDLRSADIQIGPNKSEFQPR